MSFASILNRIKTVTGAIVGVEHVIAPVLGLIPGVGPAITVFDHYAAKWLNLIGALEIADPRDGQGQIKAQAIIDDFATGLEIAQLVAQEKGEQIIWDQALLREATSDIVSGLNKFVKVKASVKSVPVTKAPAGGV